MKSKLSQRAADIKSTEIKNASITIRVPQSLKQKMIEKSDSLNLTLTDLIINSVQNGTVNVFDGPKIANELHKLNEIICSGAVPDIIIVKIEEILVILDTFLIKLEQCGANIVSETDIMSDISDSDASDPYGEFEGWGDEE